MSDKLCQATYFERVGEVYVGNFTFVISTVIGIVVEHAAGLVGENFLVLVDKVLFQLCCQPLGRLLVV